MCKAKACASAGSSGQAWAEEDDDLDSVLPPSAEPVYAREAVSAGHVVLTEEEMADVELPASEDPNCEVAEHEDTGTYCVRAICDIAAGEDLRIGMEY